MMRVPQSRKGEALDQQQNLARVSSREHTRSMMQHTLYCAPVRELG